MRKAFAIIAVFSIIIVLSFLMLLIPKSSSRESITGRHIVGLIKEDSFDYTVLFCSQDDCSQEIESRIKGSRITECAMYNFNQRLLDAGVNRTLRIITDSSYKEENQFIRKRNKSGLMHNKFCIFDGKTIITGSFNPSSSKNDRNNMIIINSTNLARNYESEFEELWSGKYGGGTKNPNTRMELNETLVENYFCPEDKCADMVEDAISKANKSIRFMAYSFTHKGIANEIVIKNMSGVSVKGIIDSSSDKDAYEPMNNLGVDARIDRKKGVMHQKVFIIDGETVITGSFNPTYSADDKNDENLLIIHDKAVASKYLEEFERVWG